MGSKTEEKFHHSAFPLSRTCQTWFFFSLSHSLSLSLSLTLSSLLRISLDYLKIGVRREGISEVHVVSPAGGERLARRCLVGGGTYCVDYTAVISDQPARLVSFELTRGCRVARLPVAENPSNKQMMIIHYYCWLFRAPPSFHPQNWVYQKSL